jgi:hypothetical protein
MANVLFWKIQFIASNPLGEYVAGDVLEFYYDNTSSLTSGNISEGITVYKNSVLITSGADIQLGGFDSYLTEQNLSQFGICNGTTMVTPSRLEWDFPYFIGVQFADFPLCAINPPTCNLTIVGVPLVVNATGPDQLDGSITIFASSSEAIQYKLGSDFVYNDGTGHQATGEFSGLLPGQYRIYVRDANNCFANVLVTVGFSNNYGVFYRLEYDTKSGSETRIDISKRDYSGGVTEVCGAGVPFEKSLRGEGSQDKFESLLSTTVAIHLTSETNFAFQSLYANSPEEFRAYYYQDSTLKGIYKVLPQQAAEDYKAPPYYVSVIATDALASLNQLSFLQDDGQRFNSNVKSIDLIAFILRKIRLNLNIRVAINMYATGMDTTDSDDPLDQAYVDTDDYYLDGGVPTLETVLRKIIEPYGARLLQENAVWNILRVEELHGEYDYREFDYNGVYVSNSSYDPVLDIIPPSQSSQGIFLSDADHFLSLCPGYGKIRVLYKLGLRENILENGNFRLKSIANSGNVYGFTLDTFGWQLVSSDYPISSSWDEMEGGTNVAWKISGDSTVTLNTGNAYITSDSYTVKMGLANTLKITIRYKVPVPIASGLSTPVAVNIPYQKVRVRVKYGSYYLLTDGTWTTDENIITIFVTEYGKFLETEFIAVQPDSSAVSGYAFDVRVYHSYIYHSEFTTFADLKAHETFDGTDQVLPTGTRTEVQTSTNPLVDPDLNYYELEETTAAENSPELVRPNDYHATNNPRQWQRKQRLVKYILTNFSTPFWIDKVTCEFLTNGERSVDTIIRELPAEPRNTSILEKEVVHGSYQNLITTIPAIALNLSTGSTSFTLTTTNVLSADILYAGYFRASDGSGYEKWTRDGVSEETSMHAILLSQYAAQYKRSWRKLTGTLYSNNTNFSFLDVFRETSDGDRLYIPVSGTIDDLNNRFNGEFLELSDITEPGEGSQPFSSAFSTGFGPGYN